MNLTDIYINHQASIVKASTIRLGTITSANIRGHRANNIYFDDAADMSGNFLTVDSRLNTGLTALDSAGYANLGVMSAVGISSDTVYNGRLIMPNTYTFQGAMEITLDDGTVITANSANIRMIGADQN